VATSAADSTAPLAADDPALRYGRPDGGWRLALYKVIFESDTRAGRLFDLVLIWLILASVAVVMLDSFESLKARWGSIFDALEWTFTVVFTIEYVARLACLPKPLRCARSPLGVIDVVAVMPTWAALFFPGLQALIDVRLLRLLRLFRILRLAEYVDEYGALGRFIASLMMLIGWGTLAVPTGIVSAEFTALRFDGSAPGRGSVCADCGSADHRPSARFCQDCGASLPPR